MRVEFSAAGRKSLRNDLHRRALGFRAFNRQLPARQARRLFQHFGEAEFRVVVDDQLVAVRGL